MNRRKFLQGLAALPFVAPLTVLVAKAVSQLNVTFPNYARRPKKMLTLAEAAKLNDTDKVVNVAIASITQKNTLFEHLKFKEITDDDTT